MDRNDWNDRYAETDLLWSAAPNRFFAAETEGLVPGRALDLACGEGRNATWLAEHGWDVTAIDFSEVAIDKARAIAERRGVTVQWKVADVLGVELAVAAFDLVAVCYLQLPAAERDPLWRRAAQAVAPGGTLVVIGHDSRNLTDGYGGPQSEDVLYTAEDVIAQLEPLTIDHGGEALRAIETETEETVYAIDCVVRATAPISR